MRLRRLINALNLLRLPPKFPEEVLDPVHPRAERTKALQGRGTPDEDPWLEERRPQRGHGTFLGDRDTWLQEELPPPYHAIYCGSHTLVRWSPAPVAPRPVGSTQEEDHRDQVGALVPCDEAPVSRAELRKLQTTAACMFAFGVGMLTWIVCML